MAKLTQEQVKERVFKNSLETCEYIDGYENVQSTIRVKCIIHNYEFETKWENIKRNNRAHHICPYCQKNDKDLKYEKDRIKVECAYCHKQLIRPKSDLKNTKSGLFFCCREHKDTAQSLYSGEQFNIMRPDHYGKNDEAVWDYRTNALRKYPNECAICKWNEDIDVLEVHHIDENRKNNHISNLIVLCPTCHRKLTTHKYELINREKIIKKE